MTSSLLSFEGFAFALNYGYNRVRFPAPLPVGSRVRMRATLATVDDIPGGAQITIVRRSSARARRSRCASRSRWRGCTWGAERRRG